MTLLSLEDPELPIGGQCPIVQEGANIEKRCCKLITGRIFLQIDTAVFQSVWWRISPKDKEGLGPSQLCSRMRW